MTQSNTATGVKDGYHWVSVDTRYGLFHRLLKDIPQIVLGKIIAITSFDSGPLTPDESEVALGWHRVGDVLWTSRITNPDLLPHEEWDEWYVFDSERVLPEIQVLVNHGHFRLDDPQKILEANPTWDRSLFDVRLALQGVFWQQLTAVRPITYMGQGDAFNLATQDASLAKAVATLCRRRA